MQRKFIGKIWTGSLALRIEQGRFSRPRLPEHERVCLVCTSDDTLENVVNHKVDTLEKEVKDLKDEFIKLIENKNS